MVDLAKMRYSSWREVTMFVPDMKEPVHLFAAICGMDRRGPRIKIMPRKGSA